MYGLSLPESRAFPDSTCYQLERACGNFFASTSYTDNYGLPPSPVSAFQRGTHNVDVTDTFKGMVDTPLVDIQKNIFDGFIMVIRVNAVSGAELSGQVKFFRVGIDSDDTSSFRLTSPLDYS